MNTDQDGSRTVSVGLSRLWPIVKVSQDPQNDVPDIHVRGSG